MSTIKWNGINFRFKNIKRTRIYKVTWKGFHDNVLGQSSLHARKQVILFLFVFFSFLCQILLICLMKAAHWSIFSAIHLTMGPNISMKEKSLFLSKEKRLMVTKWHLFPSWMGWSQTALSFSGWIHLHRSLRKSAQRQEILQRLNSTTKELEAKEHHWHQSPSNWVLLQVHRAGPCHLQGRAVEWGAKAYNSLQLQ